MGLSLNILQRQLGNIQSLNSLIFINATSLHAYIIFLLVYLCLSSSIRVIIRVSASITFFLFSWTKTSFIYSCLQRAINCLVLKLLNMSLIQPLKSSQKSSQRLVLVSSSTLQVQVFIVVYSYISFYIISLSLSLILLFYRFIFFFQSAALSAITFAHRFGLYKGVQFMCGQSFQKAIFLICTSTDQYQYKQVWSPIL